MSKKYCSCIPDVIFNIDISEACKLHDNICGEKGPLNPFSSVIPFYNSLISLRINKILVIMIVFGGTFGCLLKYPYLLYKKIIWRKENGREKNIQY